LKVRAARADEGHRLRALRLASLAADPAAFTSTHAEEAARPTDWWTRWAALSEAGVEQRTFVVADDDDRWHGLALVRADNERPGEAVINAMWVAPEARGRSAGQDLVSACAQWAAERGFTAVNLGVISGNEVALRLYEAAGFITRGRTGEIFELTRPLRSPAP
jgi:ribosomal protein S18 acetylase RimI-like enzyme